MEYTKRIFEISHSSDIIVTRRLIKTIVKELGFKDEQSEEICIVVSELASNIIKFASRGDIILSTIVEGDREGIKIEAEDDGKGIPDVDLALRDGFTTAGSLGYGLGSVNRFSDELNIQQSKTKQVTHIIVKRWLHKIRDSFQICPLDFGIASRPHPVEKLNGDSFIIKKWENSALIGIIDGLGHGPAANRAAIVAQQYVESHYYLSLKEIFAGTNRASRGTRGVVMALVLFDWEHNKISIGNVGNISIKIFNATKPYNFITRRGVIGLNAPNPVVSEFSWDNNQVMILYSDGIKLTEEWESIFPLLNKSASSLALQILLREAKDNDDATIIVVKRLNPC